MANPFAPAPEQPRLPAEEIPSTYEYWRTRQLYSCFIGYAIFYYLRENIPIALPLMERDLGLTKSQMGAFLTYHGVLYGVSKFGNGILGDRANARVFMVVGLVLSALCNLAFGWSNTLAAFSFWWILNGWFQGMGFPPCARVMSHWFGVRERGTKWAIWNSSHQVGAATVLVLAGWLGTHYGWRAIFYGPAAISLLTALFLANRLRDTPGSLGLPPVEEYIDGVQPSEVETHEKQSFGSMLLQRVFKNPYVWMICFANFFVYTIRYSFLNWAPTYLNAEKGLSLEQAGSITAGFEVAGFFGSILSGWLGDRFPRISVAVVYMLATGGSIYAYSLVPKGHVWLSAASICCVGFFIYGPQFLVGVMTVDLAGKEAAATSIGLTGFFGYLSGIVSGWGTGYLVDHYGWGASFQLEVGCSVVAAILFAACWRARPRR